MESGFASPTIKDGREGRDRSSISGIKLQFRPCEPSPDLEVGSGQAMRTGPKTLAFLHTLPTSTALHSNVSDIANDFSYALALTRTLSTHSQEIQEFYTSFSLTFRTCTRLLYPLLRRRMHHFDVLRTLLPAALSHYFYKTNSKHNTHNTLQSPNSYALSEQQPQRSQNAQRVTHLQQRQFKLTCRAQQEVKAHGSNDEPVLPPLLIYSSPEANGRTSGPYDHALECTLVLPCLVISSTPLKPLMCREVGSAL